MEHSQQSPEGVESPPEILKEERESGSTTRENTQSTNTPDDPDHKESRAKDMPQDGQKEIITFSRIQTFDDFPEQWNEYKRLCGPS